MKIKISSVLLLLFLSAHIASAAITFPGRQKDKYKNVPYIEMEDLYQEYKNNTIKIIDVRSKLEFDTIHLKGALHISVAGAGFGKKVKKLADNEPGKKIAFY